MLIFSPDLVLVWLCLAQSVCMMTCFWQQVSTYRHICVILNIYVILNHRCARFHFFFIENTKDSMLSMVFD